MAERQPSANELIISYMTLRKAVGWIGSLLPVVLLVGNLVLFTRTLPTSVSGYYYTHMRNVFVGALCALGLFLIAYAGYDEWDRWVTNAAGFFMLGVAFFPTSPQTENLTSGQRIVGGFHLAFAALAFACLGVMALRFAKTAKPETLPARLGERIRLELGFAFVGLDDRRTPRKRTRNAVYRACGIVILACVTLAAAVHLLPASIWKHEPLVFAFESIAIFAFGVSWFVKGETLAVLRDN